MCRLVSLWWPLNVSTLPFVCSSYVLFLDHSAFGVYFWCWWWSIDTAAVFWSVCASLCLGNQIAEQKLLVSLILPLIDLPPSISAQRVLRRRAIHTCCGSRFKEIEMETAATTTDTEMRHVSVAISGSQQHYWQVCLPVCLSPFFLYFLPSVASLFVNN